MMRLPFTVVGAVNWAALLLCLQSSRGVEVYDSVISAFGNSPGFDAFTQPILLSDDQVVAGPVLFFEQLPKNRPLAS